MTEPTIVCLCGSTRFFQQFQEANYRLTEELGVRAEVQKRLAGCVLHLEELFVIDLYVCRIVEGEPRPLVASALEWVDIDRAVVDRPLVPSCYLFYQAVRNHLQTVRETRL